MVLVISSTSCRNEISAREGIDTTTSMSLTLLKHLRRNEISAREGIDTILDQGPHSIHRRSRNEISAREGIDTNTYFVVHHKITK